jgi:DNA-binding transcriptional LysR family regulator
MELRVLRYFLAVAREENITKAADLLHITQPTLSRQLAALEEELGVSLFDRTSRKIVLTEEGMLLRRRAQEIVELAERTEQEVSLHGSQIEGIIRVGFGNLAACSLLAKWISDFSKTYPSVQFDLYEATADHVKDEMERGLIDVGLLLEPIDMDKYEYIRIHVPERYVAIVRKEDPLAQFESINIQQLAGRDLLLPSRAGVQNELISWLQDSYDPKRIRFSSNLPMGFMMMLEHQNIVAFAVEGSVAMYNKSQIKVVPFQNGIVRQPVLAWKRNQPFTQATKTFIEFCRAQLAHFANQKEE